MKEYKTSLPDRCPLQDSIETPNQSLFRVICHRDFNDKDFLTMVELHPENRRYQSVCTKHALSFFTTEERARRINNLYLHHKFIAEVTIEMGCGMCHENFGHINLWVYKKINTSNSFKIINVAVEKKYA